MKLLWEDRAWSDYLYWQTQDKKTLKRINALIKDILRSILYAEIKKNKSVFLYNSANASR